MAGEESTRVLPQPAVNNFVGREISRSVSDGVDGRVSLSVSVGFRTGGSGLL